MPRYSRFTTCSTIPTTAKTVVEKLENEGLKNFWRNEIGKAGGFQQVKMVAGITAKIGRFLFSASAKRILEQPKSTINFDEILDGKILICNLSKGLLGEDTSELLGISVLAKIQMAALRRARIKQSERKPFYLFVDEFQNFATPSFVQMLSEARKYKLFLTMAEQSTSQQQDQKTVDVILANVGTIICFRTGNPADEQLMLPLFSPYIEEGQIANLPSYNFYIRISPIKTQEPFSGETLLLDDEGSETVPEEVVRASREHYAKLYVLPEPKPKEAEQPKQESNQSGTKKTSTSTKKVTTNKPFGRDRLQSTRKKNPYRLAARWMMDEIDQKGSLEQGVAAEYISKEFGSDCIEQTESGNPSISKNVRDAFKKLHRATVGWEEEGMAWYKIE